jgi:hypothetical protein
MYGLNDQLRTFNFELSSIPVILAFVSFLDFSICRYTNQSTPAVVNHENTMHQKTSDIHP